MGLLDQARELQETTSHGPRCGIAKWLDTLDVATRAEAIELLDAPAVGHTTVQAVLEANGWRLSPSTIAHHRRGKCRCPRG